MSDAKKDERRLRWKRTLLEAGGFVPGHTLELTLDNMEIAYGEGWRDAVGHDHAASSHERGERGE